MESIKEWLSNPNADFLEGIKLLQQHSRNRMLVSRLAKRDSEYNRRKLSYELVKLAGAPVAETPPATEEPEEKEGENPKPPTKTEDNEEPITTKDEKEKATDDLFKTKADLFNQRAQLSDQLAGADDENLKAITSEILQLDEQIKEIESIISRIPPPTNPTDEADKRATIEQLTTLRNNARSNVSRYQKKVNATPGNSEYVSKVAQYTKMRDEYDLKLKALQIA